MHTVAEETAAKEMLAPQAVQDAPAKALIEVSRGCQRL
jgi:hypothetical protein